MKYTRLAPMNGIATLVPLNLSIRVPFWNRYGTSKTTEEDAIHQYCPVYILFCLNK